jgi:hypothetical protein
MRKGATVTVAPFAYLDGYVYLPESAQADLRAFPER